MINFRMLKLSDHLLWIAVGGLIIFSLLAIFSSTFRMQVGSGADPFIYVKRQFFSLLIASAGLLLFSYLDYRHLKKLAPALYLVMVALLLLVLFLGVGSQGAQRWFSLGPLSFQPSELSKLILVIALASFFSERSKISRPFEVLYLLLMAGLPFLLIFKQPDLGTALVFAAIFIGMLAVSGESPKLLFLLLTPLISVVTRPIIYLWVAYLLLLAVILFLSRASAWDWMAILGVNIVAGAAFPYFWGLLKPYQQIRIISFLNPTADPYGAGYHSLQSKIAIGSGGIFGKGFLSGSQTQLQFIPEQHSDFIFSVVGEEFGFIGAAGMLLCFAVFVFRCLNLAFQARDLFGTYLAVGIATMTAFHVLSNIGMTIGLLPVVGIPLPLVSYGGSSLFMNLGSVGILQSIAMRRQKIIF